MAETTAEKEARIALVNKKAADLAKAQAEIDRLAAGGKAAGDNKSKTTAKDVLKLTTDSAKLLLSQAIEDAQYTGKLSSADIADFIEKFQLEATKQMQIVIKNAQDSTSTGTNTAGVNTSDTISSYVTANYPTFFNAKDFTKDYIWSKINFRDEKTLGGNALTALSQARGVVKNFHLLGVSDAEIQIAAKAIAMGKKSIQDYTSEMQKIAMREYPTLTDRFKVDPTLTTQDIASPIINMIAKTWEVDPSTISLDNPIVASYLRPGGADGKTPPPSYADLLGRAMNDPMREYTKGAHDDARSAAISLARAFGGGI
jgi:hypothetical protein